MKLESITESPNEKKKLKAIFRLDNNRTKTIHFGAKGYEDFTQHKSEERKNSYLARHGANENFNNPLTAGALSRWVLWNKSSLKASIADFKRRFNL
jgi:hypothetical protein